jgi:hypothetical protein
MIIYEEDLEGAAALLRDPDKYAKVEETPFAAARWPSALTPLLGGRYETTGDVTVAFMHERRSPCGNVRLVVVPFAVWAPDVKNRGFLRRLDLDWIYAPGTWANGGKPTWLAGQATAFLVPEPYALRVFAGQPDTQDESHFTIRYSARLSADDAWADGIIDGWLMDDNSVKLRMRDGPLRLQLQ